MQSHLKCQTRQPSIPSHSESRSCVHTGPTANVRNKELFDFSVNQRLRVVPCGTSGSGNKLAAPQMKPPSGLGILAAM